MSELLSGGKIHKFPCEKVDGSTFAISSITNTGTNLYTLIIINAFETMPFVLNEIIYVHGYNKGNYCHPIKCKVKTAQSVYYELAIEKLSGDTMPTLGADPNTYGLFVSRNYATDLLSSKQNNIFDFETYEFETVLLASAENVVKFNIVGGVPAVDYAYFKIKMVELTTGKILYLTKSIYLISTGVYGFVDEFNEVIGTSFETNSEMFIQHVDCKYVVDVYSDDSRVGTFTYTPDKDFRFCFNMRPIFDSLFNEPLFTASTDPLSSSFSNLIDKSSTFVKKVRFDITLTSPNLNGNRSNSLQFFTAPFKSTTGRGTLEAFLSPSDDIVADVVYPFSTLKYLNGVGGILGFVGMFLRNRKISTTREVFSNDNVTTDTTIQVRADNVSFLLYSNKYSSSQAPTVLQLIEQLDESQVMILNESIQNIGLYCNQVNIMWQAPQGIGQWFFNSEYDETTSVDGTVTIINDEAGTIINHNIKPKRRIGLKTDLLGIDDRIGVASLIEAKQVWIYSYTQQRLLPCKVATNSMRIRQRDEVNSIIDFEIEIEAGVIL